MMCRSQTTSPRFTEKFAPCVIATEACCGAHYLGRQLIAQGHTTKLIRPEYVRPYVKAQKNDDRDVEAIAEAARQMTLAAIARLIITDTLNAALRQSIWHYTVKTISRPGVTDGFKGELSPWFVQRSPHLVQLQPTPLQRPRKNDCTCES